MVSSTIIEDVLRYCQSDPLLAIAYFYFDFNDPEKRQHEKPIRSLITQISAQCPSVPDILAKLFSQNKDGGQQPNMPNLMKTLKHMLGDFRHTFIILDALDECTEQEELLILIGEIVDWKLGNLHILVTSRKEREIEDSLLSCVSCQINIQSTLVDNDIQIHIRERLEHDPKLKKWPANVREEIEMTLMQGAHGM
jgi:NACHT domain.